MESTVTVGKSLVAVHDWTFLLGPGFIVGIGNGLILCWLMYRSGLVGIYLMVKGFRPSPITAGIPPSPPRPPESSPSDHRAGPGRQRRPLQLKDQP
jgi:hypothetical protein